MLNDYNVKAINDAYKNAHIAMQSISDLLPAVSDEGLKKELNGEFKGYESHVNDISAFMKEKGIEPKDINGFQKAVMSGSIKLKTVFGSSKNQAAEMMLKGTVNGINELYAMKNENENLDENVQILVCDLLKTEESYEKRLRKFL
ncbi:MAG: hypothetical protein IJU83_02725 [Clostridia bacterium]|nr:hypothetical protein [Clostridia bacterium]